jgi:glycosyltransferase involved in cell wall biosynthesis
MIQQLQRSPNPDPKKILSKILLEFVIEIQEPRKASNPQMIVKKILELVKPQYFKCVEIICNLIRKSDDYINEGREEQKITNLVENFAQNWQESDDSQHLQEIKNKIIESMALSKPVVTTTIGTEALTESQKKGLLIADDSQGLADHVIYLLDNPNERLRLGEINHQIAITDFTWEKKAQDYLKLYQLAQQQIKDKDL